MHRHLKSKIIVSVVISNTLFWENVTTVKEGVLYLEETLVEMSSSLCKGGKK